MLNSSTWCFHFYHHITETHCCTAYARDVDLLHSFSIHSTASLHEAYILGLCVRTLLPDMIFCRVYTIHCTLPRQCKELCLLDLLLFAWIGCALKNSAHQHSVSVSTNDHHRLPPSWRADSVPRTGGMMPIMCNFCKRIKLFDVLHYCTLIRESLCVIPAEFFIKVLKKKL